MFQCQSFQRVFIFVIVKTIYKEDIFLKNKKTDGTLNFKETSELDHVSLFLFKICFDLCEA